MPKALSMNRSINLAVGSMLTLFAWTAPAQVQAVETVRVTAAATDRVVTLPGELRPYEEVALVARVQGYVETMAVDRGAMVGKGQVLATLVAPEITAQVAAAQAQVESAVARRAEAEAQLASARLTHERLRAASATVGAVAGLELLRAEEAANAAAASLESHAKAVAAAQASSDAMRALEGYLRVVAPFAGRITERFVHPGALVGPSTGPLVKLEQIARLRLLVAVPEQHYVRVAAARRLEFSVTAHPGKVFSATVARIAGSLDVRTRSMAVELDVDNRNGALAPGMFPELSWPVAASGSALLVPPTAIVTTTERTFVIRVKEGKAEWVTVKKGASRGETVEVTGPLAVGDVILRRGSDEIRNGTAVTTK